MDSLWFINCYICKQGDELERLCYVPITPWAPCEIVAVAAAHVRCLAAVKRSSLSSGSDREADPTEPQD